MQFRASLFFVLLAACSFAQECEFVISGRYAGKNLYVKNPFINKKTGFCVTKVFVNDSLQQFIPASTFEIDLKRWKFSEGDSLTVKLKHVCTCAPSILSPQWHYPGSIKTNNIRVYGDSVVTFTINETGMSGKYYLQQFRWNKWVRFDSAQACLRNDTCSYTFALLKFLHSGKNKFRLFSNGVMASRVVEVNVPDFTEFKLNKSYKDSIQFPYKTQYEIWDSYGQKLMSGYGDVVNISDLYKGTFFINYDNRNGQFVKE